MRLGAETFAAGTMGRGGRVRHFEAALLQVLAVIEERAGNKTGALRVHDHVDVAGADEDVAVGGAIDQVHFILETLGVRLIGLGLQRVCFNLYDYFSNHKCTLTFFLRGRVL